MAAFRTRPEAREWLHSLNVPGTIAFLVQTWELEEPRALAALNGNRDLTYEQVLALSQKTGRPIDDFATEAA